MRFTGIPNKMNGHITEVPAFPGAEFNITIPESIGDHARSYWFGSVDVRWLEPDGPVWTGVGEVPGELAYTATVTPGSDTLDVAISLTNKSGRIWENTQAFTCFDPRNVPDVARILTARLSAEVGVFVLDHPEAGMDVDTEADLAFAHRWLQPPEAS